MGRRPRGGPPTPDRPTHARSRRVRVGRTRGVSWSIGDLALLGRPLIYLRAGRRQPGRLRAGARPGADAPRRTRPHTGHRGRTRDFRHQPYTVRCVHSVSPVFRAVPASCVCALSIAVFYRCVSPFRTPLRSLRSTPLRPTHGTVRVIHTWLISSQRQLLPHCTYRKTPQARRRAAALSYPSRPLRHPATNATEAAPERGPRTGAAPRWPARSPR